MEEYLVWEWVFFVLERKAWGSNGLAAWHHLVTVYELGYKPWLEWRRVS